MDEIFYKQDEIINMLVRLNRYLIEKLRQHVSVEEEEEALRKIMQGYDVDI